MVNKRLNFAFFVLLICQSTLADGYRNVQEGARAVGMFGGYRAFADDANANIHNPANLVDLERPMVQLNAVVGYGHNEFSSAGGNDRTENPLYGIPGLSVAIPLKDGKYAIGFSTYVPYGRSVQWGRDGFIASTPGRYPYEGKMTVFDFTPNIAMRVNDSLSVSIGADVYYGQVEQKVFLVPGFLHSKLTADGTAVGWNAAITWMMTEKQRLSATYRSPFTIKYKGESEESGLINATSDASAKIEYPTIVSLAYGIELSKTLRTEINAEWIDFSEYETLTINNPGGSIGIASSPQSQKDTITIGIGAEWDFSEHWTLRGGYKYLQAPTPTDTYGTVGPDENQGVVSIGLGYEGERHLFDVGYAVGLFDGRSISGSSNSPDGDYDYDLQVLALSYGYKF